MPYFLTFIIALFFTAPLMAKPKVELGVDLFFQEEEHVALLNNKRVGLITNHTGMSCDLTPTIDLFKKHAGTYKLVALFTPEHGLNGLSYAEENIDYPKQQDGIPIYSLHGNSKRPSKAALKNIDILVFDMQDIGVRSYTYASTLFYVMEEAAKQHIPVIVLDRPNPINGIIVDGPLLHEECRSFMGYINVPYCHGMTIGELALFFNEEYHIGCSVKVIPMRGWKRAMSFQDTGLHWIPTSPYIPEEDTPFFYPSTGILGALSLVNIGIGYTQPFKIVGAPWIKAKKFADALNAQKLPGVAFVPIYFRPFYGLYKLENCEGVKIIITNKQLYKPLSVQYLLIGMLKTLYPTIVNKHLSTLKASNKRSFCLVNGNNELFDILCSEQYPAWKMIHFEEAARKRFLQKRQEYLLY